MKEKTNKQADIGYSRTYEDKAWNHFRARLYTIAQEEKICAFWRTVDI